MSSPATPTIPPTKQCVDPTSDLFGATAVWSARLGRWLIANPGIVNPNALGGHWDDTEPADGWTELPAPTVQSAPPESQPEPTK